jgi:asparagine synthase (glutamine-hydrolysing)
VVFAGNDKKYILKEALRGIIPDEVMFRPKMGFGVPIDHWFRSELKEYTREKLLDGRLVKDGFFRKDTIRGILDQHCKTSINCAPRIWALLTLELWFEEYFD